jgi:hypothetical protein
MLSNRTSYVSSLPPSTPWTYTTQLFLTQPIPAVHGFSSLPIFKGRRVLPLVSVMNAPSSQLNKIHLLFGDQTGAFVKHWPLSFALDICR